MRQVIPAAVKLVRTTEVLVADPDGICRPYHGKADPDGVWTIGIGHVIGRGEDHLKNGITRLQAEELFARDLAEHSMFIQSDIGANVKISDWVFGAFASFAFNNGPRIFAPQVRIKDGKPCTYTPTITRLMRAGDVKGAIAKMHEYVNSAGQYRDGLFYRRIQEQWLACTGQFTKKPDNCKEAHILMNKLAAHIDVSEQKLFFARKHRKEFCPTC